MGAENSVTTPVADGRGEDEGDAVYPELLKVGSAAAVDPDR